MHGRHLAPPVLLSLRKKLVSHSSHVAMPPGHFEAGVLQFLTSGHGGHRLLLPTLLFNQFPSIHSSQMLASGPVHVGGPAQSTTGVHDLHLRVSFLPDPSHSLET
jgi:hypothetical protein